MDFLTVLLMAKAGDEAAQERILELYDPLLTKDSVVDGAFDEDLYQELCEVMLRCIKNYRV